MARSERREVVKVSSVTASTVRERKLAMVMMKVFWNKGMMAWSRVRPGVEERMGGGMKGWVDGVEGVR